MPIGNAYRRVRLASVASRLSLMKPFLRLPINPHATPAETEENSRQAHIYNIYIYIIVFLLWHLIVTLFLTYYVFSRPFDPSPWKCRYPKKDDERSTNGGKTDS